MNGFRAFQYHIALKIHFTKPNFSVFQNKGFLRGKYETYLNRNDYLLYERLAVKYSTPKEIIQFLASNIMYNNFGIVYDIEESDNNYQEYLRRKQSITKIFLDDMHKLLNKNIVLNNSRQTAVNVLNLFLGNKITIESVRILDDLIGDMIDTLKKDNNTMLLFSNDILRIEKSKGFVFYKKEKVLPIYLSYLQEEF